MNVLTGLASTPKAQNEACEAVVQEFAAHLKQHGAPAVAIKLCDELAGRIHLRRLLAPRDGTVAP